jgi:hypothetical protein
MQLTLDNREKTILLENCLQYFWQSLSDWNFEAQYTDKQYLRSKKLILAGKPEILSLCQENVLAHIILHGAGIKIVDREDTEEIVIFNAEVFNKNIERCDPAEVISLINESGDYDYTNTDNVLQTLIFGQIIYG